MSSRNSLQHTVSSVEPVGAALGDEWYNSGTNLLYKRMAVGGVPQWATITASASAGGSSTSSVVVPTNISEKINRTITNQLGYTITGTLALVIAMPLTAGFSYIVHSIYVTNIDTLAAATTVVTGNIVYAIGASTVIFANKIPVPARGALELLRKPQVLNPGDSISLQSLAGTVGTNNLLQATITYEQVPAAGNYFGIGANTVALVGDVYVAPTSSAAVIDSIRLVNTADLGNISITITWTDAANVVQSTIVSTFIVPSNSTVELCESSKYLPAGHKIRALATTAGAVSIFISGMTQ